MNMNANDDKDPILEEYGDSTSTSISDVELFEVTNALHVKQQIPAKIEEEGRRLSN